MDGVHICGNCHHGNIEKLFGTCYDDIVAFNAEEGSRGPISDLHRREFIDNIPTILMGTTSAIDHMILENITSENFTDFGEMLFIEIQTSVATNIVGRSFSQDGKK